MAVSTELWDKLCGNAVLFGLDLQEFKKLEPFFADLDHDFFLYCAELVLTDNPVSEAQRRLHPADLGKFLTLCIVYNYQNTVELYRRNSWSDEMLQDILGDFKLWQSVCLRDNGSLSLTPRTFSWARSCLNGSVKQFGRLQCNDIHLFDPMLSLYRNADGGLSVFPAFQRNNPPDPDLTRGDKVINLHVPASGALKPDMCLDSIRRMCRFSAEFHPDYDFKAVVCYSWILDPQFRSLLPESSNIVRFQKLGYNTVWPGHDQSREVIWRIWGDPGIRMPVDELPANNSLERSVKTFLQNGGKFDEGILIIFKNDIDF